MRVLFRVDDNVVVLGSDKDDAEMTVLQKLEELGSRELVDVRDEEDSALRQTLACVGIGYRLARVVSGTPVAVRVK